MILNEYKKMNIRIIEGDKVNFLNLQKFFIQIKKLETSFVHSKNRFNNPIEVVNYRSFKYYNELNDIEKLTKQYTPEYTEDENTIPPLEYYKAMNWKYRYYFLDDETINDYYYPFDNAPTIDSLINYDINKNIDLIKLDSYKTTEISPIEQLCFISPICVSEYVKNQKINKLLADKLYKVMKIELPNVFLNNKENINIDEIFNCKNARYLNKCDLNFNIITFESFKKLLN